MGEQYVGTLDQVEWENHWRLVGINKFLESQQTLQDQGGGDSSMSGRTLITKFLQPVETIVARRVTDAFYTASGKEKSDKMRPVEYYAIMNTNIAVSAFLAIRAVVSKLMKSTNNASRSNKSYSTIASNIGALIEREAQATLAYGDSEAVHKFFTNTFKNTPRGVQSKHEAFKKMIADYGWEPWGIEKRVRIGTVYLAAMEKAGLVSVTTYTEKKKTISAISLSPEVRQWVRDNTEHLSWFFGNVFPMIEKPKDITPENNSAYYTPGLQSQFTAIKRSQKHNLNNAPKVLEAINKLQAVPYCINDKVYDVIKKLLSEDRAPSVPNFPDEVEFPFEEEGFRKENLNPIEHEQLVEYMRARAKYFELTDEAEAKRTGLSLTLSVAKSMHDQSVRIGVDKFYFPHFTDFRGRVYPYTLAMNPQGSDLDKSLLLFHNKKKLGKRGKYWLAVHGANLFGKDKIALDDRAVWVEENEEMIQYIALNPTNKESVDIWGNADKPYQFLAFCFEWSQAKLVGDDYLCGLPVAIDGSCNGIQNYSAMLRDPVGAKATNLVDSELPSDIYGEVAAVLKNKLETMNDDTGYARDWLSHGITRKLTKRQVMTLPYGSTNYSCNEYTKKYADENCQDIWPTAFDRVKAAGWLSTLLWDSIGEVVIKGREAMDWLQECAKIVAHEGKQVEFITPLGFKVKFEYITPLKKRYKLRFDGEVKQVTVNDKSDKRPNKSKASTSIAPNFIHSMDASHLMLTCISFDGDMLAVHDSYATHPCDVDQLGFKTRQAFYNLYTEHNPIQSLKDNLEDTFGVELPEPPSFGEFDLKEVLRATYFFA